MTSLAVACDPYRTEPHRWQTEPWAQAMRRLGRYWVMTRHVRRYCRPLVVTGNEALAGMRGPAIIIANHTSHFDTPVALRALPERLRARTAVAAAADRFYRRTKRGWWYSLFFNAFPIERQGGGRGTLEYPLSLLRQGWSVLIYPEGTRSVRGELGEFHHGVSILAQQACVPVIPVYIDGLRRLMPKGQRSPTPAPVRVRVGPPVRVGAATSIPDGTIRLRAAMDELAHADGSRPARRPGGKDVTMTDPNVSPSAHPNALLLQWAFDAFAARDLQTLQALFSEDAVWHISGESEFAGEHRGREAGFTMIRRLLESSAGTYRLELHDVIANDDHAVALTRAIATGGNLSIDLLGSHIYHIRAGRISESWWLWDDQRRFDAYFAPELEVEALRVRSAETAGVAGG